MHKDSYPPWGSLEPERWREAVDRYNAGQILSHVARDMGVTRAAVLWAIQQSGVEMREAGHREAHAAASKRLSQRRQWVQEDSLDKARQLLGDMHEPSVMRGFHGKEGDFKEVEVDSPSHTEHMHLARAVQHLVQTADILARYDGGTSEVTVNLLLETAAQLGIADVPGPE